MLKFLIWYNLFRLGLLWYHLVATQFLALEMNSSIVNEEVQILLGRAEQEYTASPFFIFFQARACRLMMRLSIYSSLIFAILKVFCSINLDLA
jgi:hypothetical protein